MQRELPENWGEARLLLTTEDERTAARAAGLLGALQAGRSGREVRFTVSRRGVGPGPEAVRRMLARIDRAGIKGSLELLSVAEVSAPPPAEAERPSLAASWEAQLASLPPDWSDVYAELELRSTDQVEQAALLCSPLNPYRSTGYPGFRFRCARRFGYGASPAMVRRCMERLDEARIEGSVRVLHALSETEPVATQGPVWYLGGRAV
jgi:hypothetical protein